jgi:uncharacterized protein YbcC (UPF0753/DUF2309 family)
MSVIEQTLGTDIDIETIREAIESACKRIAPTWPLDQLIAVNPYWGFVDDAIQTAGRRIESYSGSRMVMPRSYYRDQWRAGSFCAEHLQEALDRSGHKMAMSKLLCELEGESQSVPRVPLATFIADSQRDLLHGMSISDFVTHNVSQHCASYFDHCQSSWETQHKTDLYQSWLHHARTDMSPWLLMGIHNVRHLARLLPEEPVTMIAKALQSLPIPRGEWENYLTALLMSMNGWASWCAYERWQAQLAQRDDDHIVQLLAIRLAWEHFAFVHSLDGQTLPAWTKAWDELLGWRAASNHQSSVDWIFQEAQEIAYQSGLCHALKPRLRFSAADIADKAAVQAVLCIDVRSEVFRRALEACSTAIQTLGFAGFFGLPISYVPLGSRTARPQLPGLLAPTLRVSESTGSQNTDQQLKLKKQRSLRLKAIWRDFRSSATSTFTFVESCGFFFAGSLIKNTLPRLNYMVAAKSKACGPKSSLRPSLSPGKADAPSSVDGLCDLVAGILTNMSLTADFARLVLLVGHGSETVNNPHAAGLDCGACGGHTGEVNARVLATLVNDQTIRAGLLERGIAIPSTTHVLAALHNTTTDEVTLFDTDLMPLTHATDLTQLEEWLKEAGHRARGERASSVGIHENEAVSSKKLLKQFQTRSRDWSQVRPEWGLVNNAAFLIAPRARSRGINLHGRVFLHEYQSALDTKGSVLEAIMTAPMLVTNWINMQYYASTVDNRVYGSGNKVLHNVVGGRLGVFEGNGGDLRIGLPLQSLHDGQALRHTPLRLSVFIEAPQSAIGAILLKHEVVRNLIDNAWIHLFQISPGSESISQHRNGIWVPVENNNVIADQRNGRMSEESYA